MADLIATFLERLAHAKGDPQAQAALAAEFALAARPDDERALLRDTLDAAAVLRWFDAALLSRILRLGDAEAQRRFGALKALPFVEPYRREQQDLFNLHESTRLGWRRKVAREDSRKFRHLSAQAAACFADDSTPAGRIEWIYQLLSGEPERGASELETLDRDWTGRARPEERYALATAIKELEETGIAEGRARIGILLVIAWTRTERGEEAGLSDCASQLIPLARNAGDLSAEASAQALLGVASEAQGKLEAAQAAFAEALAISRRLAEADPTNAGWQRDLAVAHGRVGGVLEAQGKLEAAQAAFAEALAISRRLADADPNAG